MDFYSEWDPYAADWLENLMAAGHIPGGKVDRRSIRDITAEELAGYGRAHFFTGIGGWPLALRLAGFPATESVWTGSCPCQSFSAAGEQAGLDDERNLWPPLFSQIRVRRPDTIFGEQVSNAIGFGWLDGISRDLEGEGYTVGACVLGAFSVGAPHIRKRLYWVAFSGQQSEGRSDVGSEQGAVSNGGRASGQPRGSGSAGRVGESIHERLERHAGHGNGGSEPGRIDSESSGSVAAPGGDGGRRMGDSECAERWPVDRSCRNEGEVGLPQREEGSGGLGSTVETSGMGLSDGTGWDERRQAAARNGHGSSAGSDGCNGFWSRYDLVPCSDGKARRVEPGTFPLAHGVPSRVGKLRAYGNAIVPQTAAAFIKAFMEIRNG